MIKLKNLLTEKKIGTLSNNIKVIISLDKTVHAGEQQYRHSDTVIRERDILDTVEKGIKHIAKSLMFDEIDIGDSIHIHDTKTDLNVVGALSDAGRDIIELDIITVMIKKNFKPYSGTYSFKV